MNAVLVHAASTSAAHASCDVAALDSVEQIDAVVSACRADATEQGRDFLKDNLVEKVRVCRDMTRHLANPDSENLRCARRIVSEATEVLACESSHKRYREAYEFDIFQSVRRFKANTHIGAPDFVRQIFANVIRVADQWVQPRFDVRKWTLTSYRDEIPNATAGAGGSIFASSGLWAGARPFTDFEIAAVFAHEAAHVVLEHSLKHGCLALEWTDANHSIQDATENFREDMLDGAPRKNAWAKMSQTDEYEADLVGTQILRRAGLPPEAMIDLLNRLKPKSSGGFSSGTHPEINARIQRLREKL